MKMEAVLTEIATGNEEKIRVSLKNFNDRVWYFVFALMLSASSRECKVYIMHIMDKYVHGNQLMH